MKTGILLINLGTPDSPNTADVRRYLREFLSDPRVIVLPAVPRFLLVNGLIAPFRGPKSAEAYTKIWSEQGSPLLMHSIDLRDAIRMQVPEHPVELGMRYGSPALADALSSLERQGCSRVLCVPLYPQYASSSTGSSLELVYGLAAKRTDTPSLDVLPPFFGDPRYLDAQASIIERVRTEFEADHVLLSYHGLPEHHCAEGERVDHCLKSDDCCDTLQVINRDCYRAQCFATTRGLLERLRFDRSMCTTTFQSRLGRRPWIQPHTDKVLVDLAKSGVRRLAVACPAFVADCLETLEEIGIRAAEDFIAAGGEDLVLIPALNSDELWATALGEMIRERL